MAFIQPDHQTPRRHARDRARLAVRNAHPATRLGWEECVAAKDHSFADAEATAAKVEADLIAKGESEAKAIRHRGGGDVEIARRQARADIQAELARLSLGAAEAVVGESLDDAAQADLIDQYIAQLGARS